MSITITLNGTAAVHPDGSTVADIVRALGHDPTRPGVAAAVDGTIVRRPEWSLTTLNGGEHVEVLTAVQGGA
ncbi:MAG: sulfur carrier protein ThiS [Euzebya sp.]